MPGKRVPDHQVIKYKQLRQRPSQEAAAAKVGISERTARRLDRLDGRAQQGQHRLGQSEEQVELIAAVRPFAAEPGRARRCKHPEDQCLSTAKSGTANSARTFAQNASNATKKAGVAIVE